ncbi:MAG: PD-(D/E)XK nuclease family protein, partial [Zetaproteobacteria bacterium]|nr:PD-(D/E)XK nuclease family protein [Flavobacteriales bacterium]
VKIILPSKRAIIFLKQELLNLIDKSAFLPQFFSIEAFTQNLTDLKLLDAIHLQFELFEVYKTIIPLKNQDSFEKFIEWAPIVLQDFNDLDSYLADADKLLNNLSALKRLENWFPNQEPTDLSINYLKFFETLNLLYKKFYQKLIDKQQAYQGLIYREAVNNLSIYINNFNGKLLFAGFNALNKAEEIIIQELLAHEKAELFWDIDQTFINANHPASKFINHYKSTWSYYQQKPFNWISSEFENLKSISIIGASKQVAQLKIAGELIDEIAKTSPKLNTTALVLGDERLLNVALESLPKSVENVNITMGYALQNTPLASLFINLFKANLTALKFEKSNAFYYKDFEAIWNHPYILKSLPKQKNDIISFIKKNNFDFVDYHNFVLTKLIDASNIDFIFENTGNNLIPFIENCIKLINILKLDSSFSELEKEQLYRFYNLFLELD